VVCETGPAVWRSGGPDGACVEGRGHDCGVQMACASPGQRPSCGWLSSPEGVVLDVGGEGMLVAEVEVESRVVDIRVWHGVGSGQSGMSECRTVLSRQDRGQAQDVDKDGISALRPRPRTHSGAAQVEDAASTNRRRRDQDSHDNRVSGLTVISTSL
jgi:hypothetical protein